MRIVCFGDSNTYGYDPRYCFSGRYGADGRWCSLLAEKTDWEVINAGENGREIPHRSHTLRQVTELLDSYAPVNAIIVMLGTNDLLQGLPPEQVAQRMEDFLKLPRLRRERVILVTPPPMKRGAWVESDELVSDATRLAEAYRQLAQKLGIPLVSTAHWGIDLTFDGVHFTQRGHRTFGEKLSARLEELLDAK